MTLLRLGVQGLSPPEAGLVRALMVLLARNTDGFAWVLAPKGPFDALIVDADSFDGKVVGIGDAEAPLIALLGERPRAGLAAATLARPLGLEQLAAWLADARQQLQMRTAATALGRAPAGEPPRLRLRRWPPRSLMHDDPKRIRLAAMLTRRPVTLAELVTLSGVPEAQCVAFLQLLQGVGLLETLRQPPVAIRRDAPAAAERATPTSMRTLIHKLRLHLGLEA